MAMPSTEEPGRAGWLESGAARPRPVGSRHDFAYLVVHDSSAGTRANLRGDLDLHAAPMVVLRVLDTLRLPLDRLTLDLSQVRRVDDHGLVALLVARKRARTRGIELTFEGVPPSLVGPLRRQH
jgi:anti-anti-sigma regulatory factor